jgi:hypothetical protein
MQNKEIENLLFYLIYYTLVLYLKKINLNSRFLWLKAKEQEFALLLSIDANKEFIVIIQQKIEEILLKDLNYQSIPL